MLLRFLLMGRGEPRDPRPAERRDRRARAAGRHRFAHRAAQPRGRGQRAAAARAVAGRDRARARRSVAELRRARRDDRDGGRAPVRARRGRHRAGALGRFGVRPARPRHERARDRRHRRAPAYRDRPRAVRGRRARRMRRRRVGAWQSRATTCCAPRRRRATWRASWAATRFASTAKRAASGCWSSVADAVDSRRGHEGHSRTIALWAGAVAAHLGLDADARRRCAVGGRLHDIPLVAAPEALLRRPHAPGLDGDLAARAPPAGGHAADACRRAPARRRGAGGLAPPSGDRGEPPARGTRGRRLQRLGHPARRALRPGAARRRGRSREPPRRVRQGVLARRGARVPASRGERRHPP